jgi:plastocyanin
MHRLFPHLFAFLVLLVVATACAAQTAAPTEEAAAGETEEPEATEATEAEATEGAEGAEGAGGETVTLADFAFDPAELTVTVGTEVTFQNDDSAPHTATHGTDGQAADDAEFDLDVPAGESASHTFEEAGTYEVTCRIHPSMSMTITVEE